MSDFRLDLLIGAAFPDSRKLPDDTTREQAERMARRWIAKAANRRVRLWDYEECQMIRAAKNSGRWGTVEIDN